MRDGRMAGNHSGSCTEPDNSELVFTIRQVNKEEAGAAAKPVDEDVEDTRGYDWRNKN
jgi:hypothetical protein